MCTPIIGRMSNTVVEAEVICQGEDTKFARLGNLTVENTWGCPQGNLPHREHQSQGSTYSKAKLAWMRGLIAARFADRLFANLIMLAEDFPRACLHCISSTLERGNTYMQADTLPVVNHSYQSFNITWVDTAQRTDCRTVQSCWVYSNLHLYICLLVRLPLSTPNMECPNREMLWQILHLVFQINGIDNLIWEPLFGDSLTLLLSPKTNKKHLKPCVI